MSDKNVFSSHYLAPIEYYFHLINCGNVTIDTYENYVKQTYRNRCCILSPNGIQNLTIPLVKAKKRNLTKNMVIAYDDNWRKIHWKSLESAYRSSPYFEYYEDDFYPFYHGEKPEYLTEFNSALNKKIIELLNLEITIADSSKYTEETKNDYRMTFSPKKETKLKFPPYIQVFGDRNGFTPNLSILDILFNEGPNSVNYIKSLKAI
tara:strand:+ start:1633 stop:2250 length:618 start_codon:yes stop_codon:yes gene_type:complete